MRRMGSGGQLPACEERRRSRLKVFDRFDIPQRGYRHLRIVEQAHLEDRLGPARSLNLCEESGHAPVVVLFPSGEGMVVALSAVQADSQEVTRAEIGQVCNAQRKVALDQVNDGGVLLKLASGGEQIGRNAVPA